MSPGCKRVAVFGGTFDPPHIGHFHIASEILRLGTADEVMFLPNLVPPHKPEAAPSHFNHRMRMLQIGITHAAEPRFSVNDIEGRRDPGAPSYTVDTMDELSTAQPGKTFILLVGLDSLMTLHTWCRAAEIVEKWDIATYPRSGCGDPSDLRDFWPAKVASRLQSTILPMETVDISSTGIRQQICAGEDVAGEVFPEILVYIIEKGLYLDGN
ncbi:MAG: nicotinate (nicotinamide) nucleotide adenylyltransferase [Victivallales bacterium]|nr:nicotinate (nicotinamide) nucleotide adenylyltransferase [Victivallales bacterium]